MTSYIVVDGVRKLVLPAQHPATLARRGKAPTEVMSLENTIQQVYAPGFTAVIDVPAANIRHMPPASMNVTRLVLCANYNGNKGPHSCSMGERCKFVHADHVDVASLPKAHEIHVNYAWRSLADVTYERFPPGEMLTVAPPNSGESDAPDVMESQMALRTRALESRGGGRGGSHTTAAAARPLTHCAHYYFNRTCNLGAGCQFVHAVFIDPEAKDHQRAPIPAQLGRHHGRGGRGGRGGGNQNGDRRGSNSGGGRGGASTNAQQQQQQQRHPHQQQNGANDHGYDNSNAYRGFDGRVRGDGDDLSYYNYNNNNYVAVPSSAVGAEGTPMYHWLPHHAAENVVDELPPAMPAPAGRSRGGSHASSGSQASHGSHASSRGSAAGQSDDERSLTQQPQLAGVAAAVPPLQKAARHHSHPDVWIAQDVTTSLESSTEEADLVALQQHPSSSAAASLWCPTHHHRSNSSTTIETTNTTLAAPKRSLYYSHYRHNPYSVAGPYEWCA